MQKRRQIIFLLLVVLAAALPRAIALDKVVTVDEWYWVRRSANVYYAMFHHNYSKTFQKHHPGVITQWAGALGMQLAFPQYRVMADGQLDTSKYHLFNDLVKQAGKQELDILVAGRLVMVGMVTVTLALCFLAAHKLVGDWPALLGMLLVTFDPYYLGHSRLLHLEGIFSALMLLSVLLLLVYLQEGKLWFILAAGAAAGAACLAKAPGIFLAPFIGLVLLAAAFSHWRSGRPANCSLLSCGFKQALQPWLAAMLALALVYMLLWPAMWVSPLKTIKKVYSPAISYSGFDFEETNDGEIIPSEAFGYMQSLIWRTTPVAWLGLLLAAWWWLKGPRPHPARAVLVWLALYAGLFLVMMALSTGGGKQAPHYILSTHVALNFLAGAGAALLVGKLRPRLLPAAVTILAALQLYSALSCSPYYLNYYNPLLGSPVQGVQAVGVGYGEVLEQAAAYLAQKPDAKHTTVLSWYAYGPFSYFYPGETLNLPPGVHWGWPKISRLRVSDYLVVYYATQHRRDQPVTLMETLDGIEPEHRIWYHGIEYVRIYRVSDLPDSLYTPGY
jgi:hypothetical protein